MRNPRSVRAAVAVLALVALIAVVAIPTLAASPSPGAGAQASEKPGKGPKASREPEVQVTLKGTVTDTKDADGKTSYTISANGKTIRLEAGPSWFFGAKHPLAPFVGKTVTITGGQRGDEVDVATVDGKALREPGKSPWAGGWKANGQKHPGWSQDKADRWAAHQKQKADKLGLAGGCWPPGHCKDHAPESSAVPRGD